METKAQLSTDLLRALALMQYNGEDFFILDDKAYEGTREDAEANYKDFQNESTGDEDEGFEAWAAENLPEIDERDEDEGNYLVCTDEEADERWEESLNSYLEECVYPELPEMAKRYFDDDTWKNDARQDGRGHSLAGYDGNENEETVEGETFYIYRTN